MTEKITIPKNNTTESFSIIGEKSSSTISASAITSVAGAVALGSLILPVVGTIIGGIIGAALVIYKEHKE